MSDSVPRTPPGPPFQRGGERAGHPSLRAGETSDADILAARGTKNRLDPHLPYAFLVEPERSAAGTLDDVATIFLTNRECPFRCLFCDLWKNTLDERVPIGAIPAQIDHALSRFPKATHVKLYNSGNFFDAQAIPPEDHVAIAERVAGFETVIVENHPRLCGPVCVEFRDRLREARANGGARFISRSEMATLEVALGLETVHPEILSRLNKRMTVDDFRRGAEFLIENGIAVRAFILLKTPWMEESECVDWALRSVEFAFDCGARVCSIIPTRAGNGVMDGMQRDGIFAPPRLASLEAVLDEGLRMGRGRVFVDLWDTGRLIDCPQCGPPRLERLRQMNLSQSPLPRIEPACRCCAPRRVAGCGESLRNPRRGEAHA